MSLSKCQICGQSLLSGDFTSDPSQHFCIELNGASIVQPGVMAEKIVRFRNPEISRSLPGLTLRLIEQADLLPDSPSESSSSDDLTPASQHALHSLVPSAIVHNTDDLAEIGRLHMENEALRSALPKVAVAVAVPTGQHVTREVYLPGGGEAVLVEVAVHAK